MRFLCLALTATLLTPVVTGAQNPPESKPPTAAKPVAADPPLGEVQFYRLLQEARKRATMTEEVERALRQRGISFEVTDAILNSAREMGATPRIIVALMAAEDFRQTGKGSAPESPATTPSNPPKSQPSTPPPTNPSPPAAARTTTKPTQPILSRPGPGAPESPEQRVAERVARRVAALPTLEQAREYALASLNDLPDFVADQTIRRSTLVRGAWQHRDLLETTVSYENTVGETVRLISVDGIPSTRSYEDVGGTTNVGTFSWHLTSPFAPNSNGTFSEVGQERYRGRDCLIYRYQVSKETSKYQLRATTTGAPTEKLIVGYSGRMWIDRDTKYVLRVEMESDDVPPDFPMSHTEVVVDYDWVTISERRFWLPVRAEALAEFPKQGQTFLNVIDFRNYRKFEGDIKIVD